jgi:hypothetical protein
VNGKLIQAFPDARHKSDARKALIVRSLRKH